METEITFNPSGRNGLVAVGTYLLDAAKRLGVEMECEKDGESEVCVAKVTQGADLLSPLTKFEIEYLSEDRRKDGNRLANQAKIERTGEIVVMVKEKKEPEKSDEEKRAKESRKEFEELPLEKKVAKLLELEFITLGETVSFVFNSPFKVVDKIMDVMAEFGLKMDKETKNASRPEEHKTAETNGEKHKAHHKKPKNSEPANKTPKS
ncbi:MAG: hypothetical protein ACR2GD_14045 [Pyrinomonadaceae bacterium]